MPRDAPPDTLTVPLVRQSLSEQCRIFLLDGLLSGRWQSGDRIVERQIARELGVSQAPVREALRDLQAMQLVEAVPNKGVTVRKLTLDQLSEVYEVRAALERLAADLAVVRMAGDVSRLKPHLGNLYEAASAGDAGSQAQSCVAFHREIVCASGNDMLLRHWEALAVELWTRLSLRWFRTGLLENAEDHEVILDALRRQDPCTGRLMQLHVLNCANGPSGM
ncbi:GntR family transcriptional regulator [Streptomyces sp. NBC_01727]|uniref:GntR family transcriptional regulator n=1 Tax=Streptomyces sp. NBC_01727 TaxID=2975924 RepID=UPI002E13B912|nr:GntR family transcriptional regulator [Streptomyces sp. NBC_01727]